MTENKDFLKLKSGTDIRGVAIDGVPGESINLTDDVLEKIATSFAVWLSQEKNKNFKNLSVSIGHDSRISAGRIKSVLVKTDHIS